MLKTLASFSISQTQQRVSPPVPPKDNRKIYEWYEDQSPFADLQFSFDEILGNDRDARKFAQVVAKATTKARQAKMDYKVEKLANVFSKMNISDSNDDSVDMVDFTDGSIILQDADENEFTAYVTRESKKK